MQGITDIAGRVSKRGPCGGDLAGGAERGPDAIRTRQRGCELGGIGDSTVRSEHAGGKVPEPVCRYIAGGGCPVPGPCVSSPPSVKLAEPPSKDNDLLTSRRELAAKIAQFFAQPAEPLQDLPVVRTDRLLDGLEHGGHLAMLGFGLIGFLLTLPGARRRPVRLRCQGG